MFRTIVESNIYFWYHEDVKKTFEQKRLHLRLEFRIRCLSLRLKDNNKYLDKSESMIKE